MSEHIVLYMRACACIANHSRLLALEAITPHSILGSFTANLRNRGNAAMMSLKLRPQVCVCV